MSIEDNKLRNIVEAALMAVAKPMTIEQMMNLFADEERPSANRLKDQLKQLQQDYEGRGIELKDVASGYRFQARQDYSEWLSRLWEEKPAKYSRAYLETLALIAYRQPVTRGEIEEVRGVGVSSNIIRTMLEREWIRVVGHRDVPGRPSLYATTKQFLDYFNMKSLEELPSLAEIKDLDDLNPELDLNEPGKLTEPDTSEHEVPAEVGDEESQIELDPTLLEVAEAENDQKVDDTETTLDKVKPPTSEADVDVEGDLNSQQSENAVDLSRASEVDETEVYLTEALTESTAGENESPAEAIDDEAIVDVINQDKSN